MSQTCLVVAMCMHDINDESFADESFYLDLWKFFNAGFSNNWNGFGWFCSWLKQPDWNDQKLSRIVFKNYQNDKSSFTPMDWSKFFQKKLKLSVFKAVFNQKSIIN